MNILFISHDASQTGAPMILLRIIKFIKRNKPDINIIILVKNSGPLLDEFKKLGKTYIFNKQYTPGGLIGKLYYHTIYKYFKIKHNRKKIISKIKKENINLVYSNTITNGQILNNFQYGNIKIITHVHELKHTIHLHGKENLNIHNNISNLFISVSNAVKKDLIELGINESKTKTVYEFIEPIDTKSLISPDNVKQRLNIPEGAFIVGGSGNTDWRKGADLFIQIAAQVIKKTKKDIYFIWIGNTGDGNETYFNKLKYDIVKANITENIRFTGLVDNPLEYYNILDIFALTSREDPYPLVCLEAAYLKKPVMCFRNSGGIPELLENNQQLIAKYLDIDDYTQKIITLINEPECRNSIGEHLHEKVKNNHLSTNTIPRIVELISDTLSC